MRRNAASLILLGMCAGLMLLVFTARVPGEPVGKAAAPSERKDRKALRKKPRIPAQTKRVGQGQMIAIVDGQPEKAVAMCEAYLKLVPGHGESLFNLAVARGQTGDLKGAEEAMQAALDGGLPAGRFLAGPRELLRPLRETETWRKLAASKDLQLVHGPMLGCVTDRSAKFWIRTSEEVHVQVAASKSKDLAAPIRSATVSTDAARDHTVVAEIQGLQPDTTYYYDVLLDGRAALGPGLPWFRTFPAAGGKGRFQVGFGGGAGYTPKYERMWTTIAGHRPAAFLFLGDNVYIDNPTRPGMQHYTYYRRQSRPEYRRMIASTAVYAIWDDHDFTTNDAWGGPDRDEPSWKVPVWRLYRDNWNNPAYGGGLKQPGCWFRFAIGDVDFFMLDGRYWRTSPKAAKTSMLGPVQKKWLLEELKHSRATFKVVASPVPWSLEAKGKSLDTWRGYQEERDEIFSFLDEERIEGVILLSADRHRSDVWRIDRPEGYPLWEFESSRLTNIHRHGVMPGALFGYNEKCSFGLLEFDTKKADPKVTYRIFSIDDEPIHAHVVKRSELSHR